MVLGLADKKSLPAEYTKLSRRRVQQQQVVFLKYANTWFCLFVQMMLTLL